MLSCCPESCTHLASCPIYSSPSPRAYTPQGYKTPTAEKSRPVRAATTTPTSSQLSAVPLSSSAPKAMYGKSRQTTTWLTEDGGLTPSSANTTSSSDSSTSSSKKYVSEEPTSTISNVCFEFRVLSEPTLPEGPISWRKFTLNVLN